MPGPLPYHGRRPWLAGRQNQSMSARVLMVLAVPVRYDLCLYPSFDWSDEPSQYPPGVFQLVRQRRSKEAYKLAQQSLSQITGNI